MSNDIDIRDKAILDAIAKLSEEVKTEIKEVKTEIKEVKDKQNEMDKKIEVLTEKVEGVSNSLVAKIDGINNTLGAKIDGIDKRVENLEFLNRVGVSALIGGIIALIVKIFVK